MSDTETAARTFKAVEELPDAVHEPMGDLLLVLADNKRLLGMRYSDWILGAPALEAGIACSAMAQDEWGHGRIVYAMLRDFDFDPHHLEHERDASEYRSSELLDRPAGSWPELLALNLLLDTALSVQFEAMAKSSYEPVHYKVQKLLDEERFHFEHARGWTARLAATEKGRQSLAGAFGPVWEASLRWFGPPDDPVSAMLEGAGIVDAGPELLRSRWLTRVGPVVARAGLDLAEEGERGWASTVAVTWDDDWEPRYRRSGDSAGPDAETLSRVRGDKNRSLLLD
jgi:ring-1,2-phenylacetyl-CoA epoxidase subunit PaaC